METLRDQLSLWWMMLLQGILLVLFGLAAIAWPGLTLAVLVVIFAIYVLIAGVMNIVYGIGGIGKSPLSFLRLLVGIAEVGVGVYAINHLGLSLDLLVLLIGFLFIFNGIVDIVLSFERGVSGKNRMLGIIIGALAVIAGFVILRYPLAGTLAFVWVLGIYALVSGAIWMGVSLEAKNEYDKLGPSRRAKA